MSAPEAIRFTILGEPASKANSRKPAFVGKKDARRMIWIKSDKAREFERSALLQIPAAARQRLEGPVAVTLRIFYASERPDLDESLVLDILQDRWERVAGAPRQLVQRGVYLNDRQIKAKHVYHGIDRANPRVEVCVTPLAPQQAELVPVQASAPRRRKKHEHQDQREGDREQELGVAHGADPFEFLDGPAA